MNAPAAGMRVNMRGWPTHLNLMTLNNIDICWGPHVDRGTGIIWDKVYYPVKLSNELIRESMDHGNFTFIVIGNWKREVL